MKNQLFKISTYNKEFNKYLPYNLNYDYIYQSPGLIKHIEKRHPDCVRYMPMIASIIHSPDYIGVNPNESGKSFELIKKIDKNIQVGIKLDTQNDYMYVATLHTITNGKLEHSIQNGRLKKFDKIGYPDYNQNTINEIAKVGKAPDALL